MALYEIDIGETPDATGGGCCYYRCGNDSATIETHTGRTTIGRPSIADGQTLRMVLDFTLQTIQFVPNGIACPVIHMSKAGVGNQPLRIALSSQNGGSVRIVDTDPST